MAGLTERGRLVLALAAAIYLVAWGFGTRSLYPVAVGLALAAIGARVWIELLRQPLALRRLLGSQDHVEGGDVTVTLEAQAYRHPGPRTLEVHEHIGWLGERRVVLTRQGRLLLARYVLRGLRRGRYPIERMRVVFEDPFGLARAEEVLGLESTLLVFPRLVELDRLFSDASGSAQNGGHVLLRRTAGFDLHSVREYQQGESLRKVHWRTTARRGALMIKELEDTPHDEVAVLLDANRSAVVGESFDVQVRAAGSILRAQAVRGRRALLSITSSPPASCEVTSFDGDWRHALELLAAAEADGATPVERFLERDASPAAQASELVVVTAALDAELGDALLQRALARRPVALVLVHAPSFAGGDHPPVRDPSLLRLYVAGVPVVALQRGDDLAAKLTGLEEAQTAHG